jgi:hypothetical protein
MLLPMPKRISADRSGRFAKRVSICPAARSSAAAERQLLALAERVRHPQHVHQETVPLAHVGGRGCARACACHSATPHWRSRISDITANAHDGNAGAMPADELAQPIRRCCRRVP